MFFFFFLRVEDFSSLECVIYLIYYRNSLEFRKICSHGYLNLSAAFMILKQNDSIRSFFARISEKIWFFFSIF